MFEDQQETELKSAQPGPELISESQLPALGRSANDRQNVNPAGMANDRLAANKAQTMGHPKTVTLLLAVIIGLAVVILWQWMSFQSGFMRVVHTPSDYFLYMQAMWLWMAEILMTIYSRGIQAYIIDPEWIVRVLLPVLFFLGSVFYCMANALLNGMLSLRQKVLWAIFIGLGYFVLIPLPAILYYVVATNYAHSASKRLANDDRDTGSR